jgi:hypothetical protein
MYSILLKNRQEGYKIWEKVRSLANAEVEAENLVISLVGYLEGYGHNSQFILKEHPTSTQGTPEYYAIMENDTYKIFHHVKMNYWLSSEHIYEKIHSVKIIKDGMFKQSYYNKEYYGSRVETIKKEFKGILNYFTAVNTIDILSQSIKPPSVKPKSAKMSHVTGAKKTPPKVELII